MAAAPVDAGESNASYMSRIVDLVLIAQSAASDRNSRELHQGDAQDVHGDPDRNVEVMCTCLEMFFLDVVKQCFRFP